MKPRFFFILIVIMSVSQASAGPVDVVQKAAELTKFVYGLLGQKMWDGDWKVASDEGTPVKNWKHSSHISAWINITGFNNESVINGTRYINGSGKDYAIVKRYATYSLHSDEKFTSLKSELVISDKIPTNGTNTTLATQKSTLKYKEKKKVFGIHTWIPKTETLTVDVTVESPNNFTTRIPNVTANILVYNRTIAPVTYIYVPIENHSAMKDVMIVNYTYNGSTVCRYDQVGEVRKNDRGAEYVQFLDDGWYPLWTKDENQTEIDHSGRTVTVFDPNFNISLLNISIHTPYETKYVQKFTLRIVSEVINIPVPLLKVLFLFIGSVMGLITIGKVVKRTVF